MQDVNISSAMSVSFTGTHSYDGRYAQNFFVLTSRFDVDFRSVKRKRSRTRKYGVEDSTAADTRSSSITSLSSFAESAARSAKAGVEAKCGGDSLGVKRSYPGRKKKSGTLSKRKKFG